MNLKVCTDILYLQYTSIGAIPVPVLDLDILWAAEFVLWVWSQAGKFVLWHIPQCILDHNDGTHVLVVCTSTGYRLPVSPGACKLKIS